MTAKITQLHSFTTLELSGAKTQEFLQGQLTCDMRELSSHGAYSLAACCDHRGRMVANFWVVNNHNTFLFILPKSMCDIVKNHLQKYAVFSKVTIAQDDSFFIFALALNHEDQKEDFSNSVIRITLSGTNRYLMLAKEKIFSNAEINPDENEWKKNNIHDLLCILYPETSLLFTPQMILLDKHGGVSFTKGCYVGQEIVARTEYLGKLKRHLHQLKVQSDQPVKPGEPYKNSKNEIIGVVAESIKITENSYEILAVIHDEMFYNDQVSTPQQH